MSKVKVEWSGPAYTQSISNGKHRWKADEPATQGGADNGPTPYELLLSALGACTAMTLRMYAERKEWPLENVAVELEQRRIHAKDCADCENQDGFVAEITLGLKVEGELSAEQKERLLEIAGKCPVKRTLESEIKVRSSLV